MNDIVRPTLLVNTDIMLANLDRMIANAKQNSLVFRPHFKTHQSRKIGSYYRARGINQITVSSVAMAKYFAEDDWTDITIAFPTNVRERDEIAQLHEMVKLNLIADNETTIATIESWGLEGIGLFLEVDTGYHRTGVDVRKSDRLAQLVNQASLSSSINWKGFLIHNGHSYKSRSTEQIRETHDTAIEWLDTINQYRADYPELQISVGDTPSFSSVDSFSGFEEMRPGNFIFYDLAQWQIGSCNLEDIAVCMACPVVGVYPERGELVVYGGGVHFSKDRITLDEKEVFGLPVGLGPDGWETDNIEGFVSSLSQEHGIVSLPDAQLSKYRIGDLIGVLPVHSCLAAEAMKSFRTLEGNLFDHF